MNVKSAARAIACAALLAGALPGGAQAQGKVASPPHLHLIAPRPPAQPAGFIAPTPPSGDWGGMQPMSGSSQWQPIGPGPLNVGVAWSGRVAGIAADPVNPNICYVAAAGGGVWKTADAGVTWTPLTDSQSTLAMGSIAVAPSNGQVIYAGTGEANNSLDSMYGYGILKSTDGGVTWTLIEGNTGVNEFAGRTIADIKVLPSDPNTVYAAVGDYGTNGSFGNTGIYKTTDGGATWTNTTSSISTNASATAVLIDPASTSTLFCAYGAFYGDAANGVYKSTNGGSTWAAAGNFPMGSSDGRIAIAESPTSPNTLYAVISDPSSSNVLAAYKSTDGGATWSQLTGLPSMGGNQAWYNLVIAVDPSNANKVYVGCSSNYGYDNIIQSTDGGSTWTNISTGANGNGPHSDEHAMAFDSTGLLLNGCDGGIWRLDNSTPGSILWTDINGDLETIQFTGASLHPTQPTYALAGSQDNGTELTNNNIGWQIQVGGDGGFARIDQTTPATMYGEFTGVSLYKTTNGGSSWNSADSGISSNNANFYVDYILDPANSSRILYPTDYVNESTNGGASWTAVGTPGSGGFNASDAIVDCLAVNGNTIYASAAGYGQYGYGSSAIYVTTNNGSSWSAAANPPGNPHISDITVDPGNSMHVFATGNLFGLGHVFVSTNGGSSWANITNNLPDVPTNAVKYDSTHNIIYVGTDAGVYASTDSGSTWSVLGTGLANARVVDLELNTSTGYLLAATHGRGCWELALSNASPVVVSLSPASTGVGSPSFTLTVTGSGFVSGAAVEWNGSPLTTTFVSSTQLQATVLAADVAATGLYGVSVANSGGAPCGVVPFTVTSAANNNPAPVVKGLSPSSALAGGGSFKLTVKGTGFIPASTLTFNTTGVTITSQTSTALTATVSSSLIASAGKVYVTVTNPAPGGGSSKKPFTILLTNLSLTVNSLTRNGNGSVTVNFTLKNIGHNAANSTQVKKALLNKIATSTGLPLNLGNIAAGGTASSSLTFPNPGTAGTKVPLAISGAFTGGTFSASTKVTLP